MAAPNIATTAIIKGKTVVGAITTSAVSIVTNAAASGKVFRLATLLISNVSGTVNGDVSVYFRRSSVNYRICFTIAVPADSTLAAISKENTVYLEEGDEIQVIASANSVLEYVASYEEIS
jgi:hypothetical protein